MELVTKNGEKTMIIQDYIVDDDEQWMYAWYGYESTSHKEVEKALRDLGSNDLTVQIDGYGGSMRAASRIHTEFMNYGGKVKFEIPALAASAMSLVTTASSKEGNSCHIAPMGFYMMHNAQGGRAGDYRDMETEKARLEAANENIINAYQIKSGLARADLQELMDKETWLSANDAVEKGFVDGIIFDEHIKIDTSIPNNLMNSLLVQKQQLYNSSRRMVMNSIGVMDKTIPPEAPKPQEDLHNEAISFAMAELEIEKQRFGGIINE